MKHLIVGVGAAGIAAAAAIKKQKPSDEVVMISTDESVYSRCMLHHYISGKRDTRGLSFVPEGFFKDNKIRWISGETLTGVDTAAKTVNFGSQEEPYDALLIAAGGKSFFPPIEGITGLRNVYGLRDLSDARSIKAQAEQNNDIVIIGAGLVGMDAAYAFAETNRNGADLKPVVVEIAESILPLNLDADAAKPYMKKFEEAGCIFRLGRKVVKVKGKDGSVQSVILDDGTELPCSLLILATGIRPNTGFLEGSGIALDGRKRGVKVNKFMETGVKDVYAAGDVTGLSEDWPNAHIQGKIAGANMCGGTEVYYGLFPPKNTINFFDIPSLSLGQITPMQDDVVECRQDRKRYEKIILRDGVPVGVILRGDISNCGFWQYLIKNKLNISHIQKPIWKVSFADAYGLAEDGEYRWQSG